LDLLVSAHPLHDLQKPPAVQRVRARDAAGCIEEAVSIGFRNLGEECAILVDFLEQFRGGSETIRK
jgi:hypothetical protein